MRFYAKRTLRIDERLYDIKRIRQRDGDRRFDITLPLHLASEMRAGMHRLEEALGAKIIQDRPLGCRGGVGKPRKVNVLGDTLSAMTYNINGLRTKVPELSMLLEKVKPMILGLQETNRQIGAYQVRLPGYATIESQQHAGNGGGVLLGVRRDSGLSLMLVASSEFLVAGRISGEVRGGGVLDILTISTYIPCSGRNRKLARNRLTTLLASEAGKYQAVIVLGDFNPRTCDDVDRLFSTKGISIHRAPSQGCTWQRASAPSNSILDFVLYRGLDPTLRTVRVLRTVDLSDHYPVCFTWEAKVTRPAERKPKIDASKIKARKTAIVEDTRWGEMHDGSMQLTETAKVFVDIVWAMARDHNLMSKPAPEWKINLSRRTLSIIQKRRRMFKERGSVGFRLEAYRELWEEARRGIREDQRRQREAKISNLCRDIQEGRSKDVWKFVNRSRGASSTVNYDGPLLKPDGELAVSSADKALVCANHFETLATDLKNNSRNASCWTNVRPNSTPIPACNDPLDWEEVRMALLASADGKAPGLDGIPMELLKLASTEEGRPQTPLGKVIWKIISQIWEEEEFPGVWASGWIVPLAKKGDPRDLNNYRGISLLCTMPKLLSKIVATRLNTICEQNSLLCREQAGFRTREECVAQATSLVEIVTRRKEANVDTYCCFIDFSKAYDRVPHEGLLSKLSSVGIQGKLLGVIRGMYKAP
ncbi:MAG: reverse transcriptase family protein, partial [Aeromonas sp.]